MKSVTFGPSQKDEPSCLFIMRLCGLFGIESIQDPYEPYERRREIPEEIIMEYCRILDNT